VTSLQKPQLMPDEKDKLIKQAIPPPPFEQARLIPDYETVVLTSAAADPRRSLEW
jgi:hypothetical protein